MYARTQIPSPIGRLTLVAHDDALVAILFDTESDERDPDAHNPSDPTAGGVAVVDVRPGDHPVLATAAVQLGEYFAGRRTEFDLPLDPHGTPFQRAVWDELREIPYGETITYGQQAIRLGDRNWSRAVGAANGRNPIPIVVPCHRVVGADGKLTGYAGGMTAKAWLLEHEFEIRARK